MIRFVLWLPKRVKLILLSAVSCSNSAACSSAVRKPAISLADSTDLRVLLNIMYLMVETIQQDDPADKPEWKIIRETFRAELGECVVGRAAATDYI